MLDKRKLRLAKEIVEVYSSKHLYSVIQWMEFGECCPEIVVFLKKRIETQTIEYTVEERKEQEKTLEKRALRDEKVSESRKMNHRMIPLLAICPDCRDPMQGFIHPHCEMVKTGRFFYAECTKCAYYNEIFLDMDKIKEINKAEEMERGVKHGC